MTHLIELDLSNNELTGPILSSFSQLENLEFLDLSRNNLIGTVEADIFFSHKKLESLSLSSNNITFITHHHINFTIPTLRELQLDGCNLRKIPYFLKLQNNLEILFLSANSIHGKIPHWIWNVSDHLGAVDLSSNFLTSIEHNLTVFSSKSLEVIDIGNNMLQGNLPVPPPNTIEYRVSNNRLTGDIPPLICSGMSLTILDLSYNNMSGPIPRCLSNSLASLNLQSNNFSGTIPQLYSEDCNLKEIDLSQNQLKGEVPKSLMSCKMLEILDLSDNQIEQTFPAWLGTLPQLQVLFLHSNKFHGALGSPRSPLEFPMLRIIDVSHNSLTGVLPVEYIKIWNAMKMHSPDTELYIRIDVEFNTQTRSWHYQQQQSSITLVNKGVETEYKQILNILTAIDLSSNNFTGEIPESLGSLKELELLNLSNNELTGPIPQSLANLTKLESLDLSQNKLTGVIPQQLASQLTSLEFFNVSYNLLSGHIPQGSQFGTFDKGSYVGNSGLCAFPLSNCGTVHSPPADGDEGDSDDTYEFPSGFDWMFILAGVGSGLVVGFVMGNILTDRYPWLISSIAQSFACREKKQRRAKRSIIRR
nr:PREDICTED: receptor-like protein 12 [Daucus carota subsp. sativus]